MGTDLSLEQMARNLFEKEWRRVEREIGQAGHEAKQDEAGGICLCPPVWLLPGLIAMVEESHNEPVDQLAPTIQRMVLEQNFVDAHGDGIIRDDEDARVSRLVVVLVRVLEQVRRVAIDTGRWSDMPATPLMCG